MIGVASRLQPLCVNCGNEGPLNDQGRCSACPCGECDKGLTWDDKPCSCALGEQRRVLARILEPVIRRAVAFAATKCNVIDLADEVIAAERAKKSAAECPCGDPLYSDTGLCLRCHEDAFDARNRARPRHMQVD